MRSPEALPTYRSAETLNWPKVIMPLSQIPEVRPSISSDLLNTAGHELNHALVAIACGASVVSISVRREGDSLGRTMFAGSVSPDTMKVIAAAGSVAACDGCASGYGSDIHHARLLTHFYGGISLESATVQAKTIISNYSIEVRKKVEEIVAYYGTHIGDIPGSLIPAFLSRARMEVNLEKGILGNLFVAEDEFKEAIEPKEKPKDYTVIDNLEDGSYRIRYAVGGEIKREDSICGVCNDTNGHYKDCPKHRSEKQTEIPTARHDFPKEDIIFSRN